MGYYSELSLNDTCHESHSHPSPELQLKWRIEDLKSRLEDIAAGRCGINALYFGGCRYSREDLVYTPPEYFSRECDLIDAIALAEERLASIEAEEVELQEIENRKIITKEFQGQLTIWDIIRAKPNPTTQHKQEPKAA